MYFGNRPGYVREITAFIFGTDLAAGRLQHGLPMVDGFAEYVCARLSDCDGQHPAWSSRIENATATETEAWRLFVELWTQYRAVGKPA